MLYKERCIKEHIYFELLYVSAFSSLVKVSKNSFSGVRFRAKFEVYKQLLRKLITKKDRQMKLTRFIFSRRFEVIVTPLSSDKYLQVLEFK